jgi:hypothetical protein
MMEQATMEQFEAMRADIEIELADARERVTEAEAAARDAEAARVAVLADRDAMQAAISPLGTTVTSPVALRLADKSRDVARVTGEAVRTKLFAEAARARARARAGELEAAIAQVQGLIDPPKPEPELIEDEAA